MKFVIGLFLLLASSISFAATPKAMQAPFATAQGQSQQYPGSQDDEGVPWAPVYRRSKVKVTIYKNKILRVGDNYQNVPEKICTKESSIKVWDLRQPYDGYTIPLEIKCQTQINGENMIVSLGVNASVSLQDMHLESKQTPMLNIWGMLFFAKDSQSAMKLAASSATLTKDLDLKSSFIALGQQQFISCENPNDPKDCTIENPEVLDASVEYIGE